MNSQSFIVLNKGELTMNKRDWMIWGMMMCWSNFWVLLGFFLYSITEDWISFIVMIFAIFGFYFPMYFEEESEYY